MMKKSLEQLREELKNHQDFLKRSAQLKSNMRTAIRTAEKTLKNCKRHLNRLLTDIRMAKRKVKSLKSGISSYPRRLRQWTESHIGELINKAETVQ